MANFLKTWRLQSNSVTRQVTCKRTKMILAILGLKWINWSNKMYRQTELTEKVVIVVILSLLIVLSGLKAILILNWIPRRKMLKNAIMRLTRRIITHPINLLNWSPIFPASWTWSGARQRARLENLDDFLTLTQWQIENQRGKCIFIAALFNNSRHEG